VPRRRQLRLQDAVQVRRGLLQQLHQAPQAADRRRLIALHRDRLLQAGEPAIDPEGKAVRDGVGGARKREHLEQLVPDPLSGDAL
jgi:hypothetical protein